MGTIWKDKLNQKVWRKQWLMPKLWGTEKLCSGWGERLKLPYVGRKSWVSTVTCTSPERVVYRMNPPAQTFALHREPTKNITWVRIETGIFLMGSKSIVWSAKEYQIQFSQSHKIANTRSHMGYALNKKVFIKELEANGLWNKAAIAESWPLIELKTKYWSKLSCRKERISHMKNVLVWKPCPSHQVKYIVHVQREAFKEVYFLAW